MRSFWLFALLLALPAGAQLYEDQLEPAALGIEELAATVVPPAVYVGPEACRPCHEAAYAKWLGSKHARTSVWLHTRMARTVIAPRHGIKASAPENSAVCLGCHGTGVDAPAAYRDPGFRIREGVSCEKCHGPGADHVRDPKIDLRRPAETFCAENCHRPKESHAAVGAKPFSFATFYPKIAHLETKAEK